MINESRDLVGEILSPQITNVIARAAELNSKNIYVLQIWASLCYKLRQLFLLQIRENVVINWDSFIITNWGKCCYKLVQPLFQNRAAITNWGKIYYKLGQVLQLRAIITNWGITATTYLAIRTTNN